MKSEYKGVHWIARYRKFKATIQEKGEVYHCGYHDNARDGARAIDNAILRYNLDRRKLQTIKPKQTA